MKEISELIKYSCALYDRHLVHASGCNTSVRVGDLVWITQTGAILGELTQNSLSKVTLDGELLAAGKSSKEMPMQNETDRIGNVENLEDERSYMWVPVWLNWSTACCEN